MNLRKLAVLVCALPLLGLTLASGCGGEGDAPGVAEEPNIGPGEPPGKPPGTKAASKDAPATKPAAEKSSK